MLPDNELVTWEHCGHRYELILTRLHPERYDWQPTCDTCGKRLRSGIEQYQREREVDELVEDIREIRTVYARLGIPCPFGGERDPGAR
ncbi:MAG: hypothetical protein ACREXY_05040 [Gammaproteobacteria bacterium]